MEFQLCQRISSKYAKNLEMYTLWNDQSICGSSSAQGDWRWWWRRYLWMMASLTERHCFGEQKRKRERERNKMWCKPFSVKMIIDDKYQSLWPCQTCICISISIDRQRTSRRAKQVAAYQQSDHLELIIIDRLAVRLLRKRENVM